MTGRSSLATALASACVGLLACNPWYIVDSSYHAEGGPDSRNAPDVVRTSEYERIGHEGLFVALRAPDQCANLSSAESTGEASGAGDLIRTDCGVEMAELERALVRSGYRVVAWNEVRTRSQADGLVSPTAAAEKLGAKILFQVNSLERSFVGAGLGTEWRRKFYKSDLFGTRGVVASVPPLRADALTRSMRALEEQYTPPGQLAITVDATAIWTKNGESVWFYHATEAATPAVGSTQPPTLTRWFECNRSWLQHCVVHPMTKNPGVAGTSELVRSAEQLDQARRTLYFDLLQSAMASMVKEFRRGGGG